MAQLQTEIAYLGNDMFVGEARPGSSPGSAKWRIYRVYDYATTARRTRWANGNARFNKIFARYNNYAYVDL